MSEMVERVALALCNADQKAHGWPLSTGLSDLINPDGYTSAARAAIAAMREPTEAMLSRVDVNAVEFIGLHDTWRAMIDEALRD